jgi:hypothetical protein
MEADPVVQTTPPYVPVRSNAWPKPRIPRWVYLAFAALLIVAVLVALVHKPSKSEQATDLRGFLSYVTGDIESCAGGVGESLQALRAVQAGQDSASDVSDGISVAQQGAQNCGPATNMSIDDLESYQVEQSLDGYKLAGVVTGLINWAAPDAQQVQTDVANLLSARTTSARGRAQAKLNADLVVLNRQRSQINGVINAARKALGVTQTGPTLPG